MICAGSHRWVGSVVLVFQSHSSSYGGLLEWSSCRVLGRRLLQHPAEEVIEMDISIINDRSR